MDLEVPERTAPTRVTPERRTRIDLIVAALIVVAVLVVGGLVWWFSPVRHSESVQASDPTPTVTPVRTVPESLVPLWQEQSSATRIPVISTSSVVTGDAGTVVSRDPDTGAARWSYRRNLDLCAVATGWSGVADTVLAVYRNSRGCSEVTALDASTGQRTGARTSDADDAIYLNADSGYALAQGNTRLETWGSNLVRGIEYGRVAAPVKPGAQPSRTGCALYSSALSGDRLAVIERCASDPGYRLSVLGSTLDSDEKVRQFGSSIITVTADGPPPRVIAMSSSAIAVYDGGGDAPEPDISAPGTAADPTAPRRPTIRIFDTDGVQTGVEYVTGGLEVPTESTAITRDGLTTFWTGAATVVLNAQSMKPTYQVPGTLGPGELMGDGLLLPSPSGISVRNPATGAETRSIAVPRDGHGDGQMVALRVLGDHVVQQWGTTVQVLGPRD